MLFLLDNSQLLTFVPKKKLFTPKKNILWQTFSIVGVGSSSSHNRKPSSWWHNLLTTDQQSSLSFSQNRRTPACRAWLAVNESLVSHWYLREIKPKKMIVLYLITDLVSFEQNFIQLPKTDQTVLNKPSKQIFV